MTLSRRRLDLWLCNSTSQGSERDEPHQGANNTCGAEQASLNNPTIMKAQISSSYFISLCIIYVFPKKHFKIYNNRLNGQSIKNIKFLLTLLFVLHYFLVNITFSLTLLFRWHYFLVDIAFWLTLLFWLILLFGWHYLLVDITFCLTLLFG